MRKNKRSKLKIQLESVRSSNERVLFKITRAARLARNHGVIDSKPPPPPPPPPTRKKPKTKEETVHGK